MSDLPAQIGRAIRHHRERVGLSQTALGEVVGRSVQAIGNVERGKALPALETLEAIANALDTPIRDFFPSAPGADGREEAVNRIASRLKSLAAADLEAVDAVVAAVVAVIRRA